MERAAEIAHGAGAQLVIVCAYEPESRQVQREASVELGQEAFQVVGNRGLNSLAGRILGSVPAEVSRKANCDVLIVHTVS